MAKRFSRRGKGGRAALASVIVIVIILASFAGSLALWSLWADAPNLKDAAGVIQALMASIAIGIGGVFAWFKLRIFRDLTPHLTITHEVSHRIISPSYALIDVAVVLHNGSRVHVELREAVFRLQMVSPLSDEEVAVIYDEMLADSGQGRAAWPLLLRARRNWNEGELIIEPGETHRELFDFIVSTDVAATHIYTFFRNPNPGESGGAEGWNAATVYDMSDYSDDL